jgi:hypothetical protein
MSSRKTLTLGRTKPKEPEIVQVPVQTPPKDNRVNLEFEAKRIINAIVENGRPALERGEMLAEVISFAEARLEQVSGEITDKQVEDLSFLD